MPKLSCPRWVPTTRSGWMSSTRPVHRQPPYADVRYAEPDGCSFADARDPVEEGSGRDLVDLFGRCARPRHPRAEHHARETPGADAFEQKGRVPGRSARCQASTAASRTATAPHAAVVPRVTSAFAPKRANATGRRKLARYVSKAASSPMLTGPARNVDAHEVAATFERRLARDLTARKDDFDDAAWLANARPRRRRKRASPTAAARLIHHARQTPSRPSAAVQTSRLVELRQDPTTMENVAAAPACQ